MFDRIVHRIKKGKVMNKKEKIKQVRDLLLKNGFTVIQSHDEFFTYMKDNKFGRVETDRLGSNLLISSCYPPSKKHGTGARYAEESNPSIGVFEASLNHTIVAMNQKQPAFYSGLKEYLRKSYFMNKTIILEKNSVQTPLDVLEGDYVFASNRHAPVVHPVHKYLHTNFFDGRNDDFKAIFEISKGKLETRNHNINMFDDGNEMEKLKQSVLDPEIQKRKEVLSKLLEKGMDIPQALKKEEMMNEIAKSMNSTNAIEEDSPSENITIK